MRFVIIIKKGKQLLVHILFLFIFVGEVKDANIRTLLNEYDYCEKMELDGEFFHVVGKGLQRMALSLVYCCRQNLKV